MAIQNDRFLRALLKQPVDKTPVWIMRQAGRYLPEYRALREKAKDFLVLCKTPELACEVTLQPLKRFDLDAAIIFSDILTIPDAMDLGLYFSPGEGPCFQHPIRDKDDIESLVVPEPEEHLSYVTDAICMVKKELDGRLPLIGFSGSPWTLATYMVEGGTTKSFSKIKKLMFSQPEAFHQLLDKLVKSVIKYLNAQIVAGADAVMIFDSWGGVLTPRDYLEFSLEPMRKIVNALNRTRDGQKIPVILFTKNGGQWLESIADSQCDAIGLDWTTPLGEAAERVGHKVALQGNMDPGVLYASPERIEQEVRDILGQFKGNTGHVFNLGHGITPDVNPDHVHCLVEAVHGYRA